MRMRKKKNLDERLQLCSELFVQSTPGEWRGDKGATTPLYLEIGCGKGRFCVESAKEMPECEFVAVEREPNVIVMAAENAKKENLTNLKFLNSGADYLPRYIKDLSMDNVYLNFSPPYPGDAYENRRLTCDPRIVAYKAFLKDNGCIYQKTDDKGLFDYSFAQFVKHGFEVEDVSDKINQGIIDNVETEYEKKFRALGLPIYALIAKKV